MSGEKKNKNLLGLWDCMGIGIGQIIGSGIMVFTGMVIGMTGYGVPWAFLAAAAVVIIQIIPQAIQSSAMPVKGGSYVYVREFLGKKIGFFYLTTTVISSCIIASMAISFGEYTAALIPGVSVTMVAFLILTLCYILNLIGLKTAARAQGFMVACLMLALFLFIAFGLPKVDDFSFLADPERIFPNGFGSFFGGVTMLTFATQGAKFLMENGDQVENPGKTLPQAMIGSTVLVALFYAFIAVVAVGVLPLEQTANQSLVNTAKAIFPPAVYIFFVVGGAMFALATTLNGSFAWMPQGLFVAAREGWIHPVFKKTNKAGTPWLLLTIFYVINAYIILADADVTFISLLGTGVTMIANVIPALACVTFLQRRPDLYEKSYIKLPKPVYYAFCIIFIVVALYLSSRNFAKMTPAVWAALAAFCIIVPAYSAVQEKKLEARKKENN